VRGALRGKRVVEVAAGTAHTAVMTLEGDLYTWGGGSQKLAEERGMPFYTGLCKLGQGPIDEESWCYLPRLVSSRWSVDCSQFRACDSCASTTDVKRCKCLQIFFCSKQCQQDAWLRHKVTCKATRAAARSREMVA
jgi:hypothetical protein